MDRDPHEAFALVVCLNNVKCNISKLTFTQSPQGSRSEEGKCNRVKVWPARHRPDLRDSGGAGGVMWILPFDICINFRHL